MADERTWELRGQKAIDDFDGIGQYRCSVIFNREAQQLSLSTGLNLGAVRIRPTIKAGYQG